MSNQSISIFDSADKRKHSIQAREAGSWRNPRTPSKSPTPATKDATFKTPREVFSERKTVHSIGGSLVKKSSRSYVRAKNLNVQYEIKDFELPDLSLSYDLVSVVRKLNEYEMWESESSRWLLKVLYEYRTVLLPKGAFVVNLQTTSLEVKLKLLNLRNCVGLIYHRSLETFRSKFLRA
jgi:hypothetical protein